jgi:hypothetical protein
VHGSIPRSAGPARQLATHKPVTTRSPSTDRSRSTRESSSRPSGVLSNDFNGYTDLADSEFRLIRILPAKMSTIKCELIHASLDKPPRYLAISYAWGDPGDTRKIMLGGVRISVAVSLHGALEALRQKNESVLVWADALCINQQDHEERAQQVQLMPSIYKRAESVSIWLGPESDGSQFATKLLEKLYAKNDLPTLISEISSSRTGLRDLQALVSLFEREYWNRLWVVQEVFNARDIVVHCGHSSLPWEHYKHASHAFRRYKRDLDQLLLGAATTGRLSRVTPSQFTHSQVLTLKGPGSLPDITPLAELGEDSLFAIVCACRRKFTADARDKVFGILGLLPLDIRKDFPADYSLSVKEVYLNLVDYVLSTQERLDIICESVHFPLHINSMGLPSWAPNWSHIPGTNSLARTYDFSASLNTKAKYRFLDDRRNHLEVSAVYIDSIRTHGIAVGTLCTLADYLMAFMHWRSVLLNNGISVDADDRFSLENAFARTLSLGQIPSDWANSGPWFEACYHVFATLTQERLPNLPLDPWLLQFKGAHTGIDPAGRRQFLQEHFAACMMGRSFCITEKGHMGMGSGFMAAGDIVVVPLGCSTPILLRPEGNRGEYRFVGDVYINMYMYGKAVEQWKAGKRKLRRYVLH